MKSKVLSHVLRYSVAVVSVVLAAWWRLVVDDQLQDRVPFVTFFLAVVVAAWWGGFGPAVLAVVLSGLVASHFFIPPDDSIVPGDAAGWVAMAMFTVIGVATAFLSRWTQRKSIQIRQGWERFFVTLSSIGDGVIVTDGSARITFLNQIAEELTGWPLADAKGKPLEVIFEVVNEQTRQPIESLVARVLREGQVISLTSPAILIAKDGTEHAVDDSAAPIRESDGTVVGVVLVFRDVSQQRASQLAAARLAALVDSSEDAIIGQSLEGVITEWNAGAERLFGFSAEEAVGRLGRATIVPAEREQELHQSLQRIGRGERVEPFETTRLCKDGRKIPVAVRISPIRNAEGAVVGASAIDRDISLERAAEQRRNARLAVTQILAHEQRIEKAIANILEAVASALDWDVGGFWRVQPEQGVLRCCEFWHSTGRDLEAFRDATMDLRLEPANSLPGRVWRTGKPHWSSDVVADTEFVRASEARAVGLHGGFACPISVDQEVVGVVEWFSHEIQQPDEDLLEMMATIGGQIGQFIERRQAEAKLQDSEARLRLALEAGQMGTWEWQIATGRVSWSETLERIHGLAPGTFAGTFEAYQYDIHPDDKERVLATIREAVEQGDEHHLEYRIIRPDGSMHWLEARGRVFHDESGQPSRLVGICSDISSRKRLEHSLRFLAEASKSLSSLVDYRSTLQKVAHLAVPDFADWCAVDMTDSEGVLQRVAVAHVDPAKVQWAEELHRRYAADPNDAHGAAQVFRTGQSEMASRISDDTLREVARDKEHLRILRELDLKSYLCVPLRAKERTIGVMTFVSAESGGAYGPEDLSIAEDLAHRAAVAVENARLYQEVREADRRKDEFLAMLAHELRNPLAPIRSGLDILAMDAGSHQETVALMQDQLEHVVRLVDDLLDVSRIMRGKVELRRKTIELADLVKQSVQAVQPMIDSRQQQLLVRLSDQPIWVHADPVRLVQVIENLLNNASKYTDAEGRIELSVEHRDRQAVIRVSDSGIGIEPELLPKVFELFTQSSRSLDRAQGGLGIGLTLVQRLVAMHGGTASVQSDGPGCGSTFQVVLPAAEGNAQVEASPTPLSPTARRRILVVDDNVGAAEMLAMLLAKLDRHQVETAHSGTAAIEKIGVGHPEIVFLDIGLPGMDGYAVARKVRQELGLRDLLLVALTGYGQAEDRQRSKDAGFDEHLVKPPSVDQIREILAHPKLKS